MNKMITKSKAAVNGSKGYIIKAKDLIEKAEITELYILIESCDFSEARRYIRKNRMSYENVSIAASKAWQEKATSGSFPEADRIGDYFGSPAKMKSLAGSKRASRPRKFR
ncbi:MAG: hypothetical protein NTY68_01925 [Candidatus Micrarchaeota archaeon]|nr:hypothetical protein [Candidatus Micrarchaeota archaeon]